jgi:hypothetical protein
LEEKAQATRFFQSSIDNRQSSIPSPLFPVPCPGKVAFIPVGANVPMVLTPANGGSRPSSRPGGIKTIGVFGITDAGAAIANEVSDLAFAAREAGRHVAPLRLLSMGRGSQEAGERLGQALNGSPVELLTLGRLSSEDISRNLARSDVAVFVRGGVSSRRGGAIAAIACGVPLVAYSGPETGPPLTEAGVLLVPPGDREELARAVIRVLTDDRLWQELHGRSLRAQQQYFSWEAIVGRFVKVLDHA